MSEASSFILGLMIGVLLVVFIAKMDGSYKQGQIDAMTGHYEYCQNERLEWIAGEPVNNDGWKCK